MNDTKEKILITALGLFAKDGYEAVSVSTIAGILGITKGALYRHYKNKREIFDRIVERMIQMDVESAKKHEVPEATFDHAPSAYRKATMDKIKNFIIAQFQFWTENEYGRNFRKMVTLEQYRNPEMADWYQKVLGNGPVSYIKDLFREMMRQGVLKKSNPGLLAIDFYAPFYLLLSMSDAPTGEKKAIALLKTHIDNFIQTNATRQRKKR